MTDETKPAAPDQDKLYGTGMVGHIRDAITEWNDRAKEYHHKHMTPNYDPLHAGEIDLIAERIFLKLVRKGWAFGSYR